MTSGSGDSPAIPAVVGRTVRLGSERRTVAGVMPEGFTFPATHQVWIPLRVDPVGSAPGEGPGLLVFGRLDRDASREQAQAEILTIGQRTAVDRPATHEHLRPQLVPYVRLFFDSFDIEVGLAIANIFVVMLLVLVSANVALLLFARAATRESEIAVRSALGASRARIVGQLFVEGLVLAALAVVVGLVAARVGLRSLLATLEADSARALPFWMGDSLTPTTVMYAGALTILSACHHQRVPRAESHQPRTGGPAPAIDGRRRRLPVRRSLDRRHRVAGRRHAHVSGRRVLLSSLRRPGTDRRYRILRRQVPLRRASSSIERVRLECRWMRPRRRSVRGSAKPTRNWSDA